jgi:hypothetical protein
MPAARGIGLRVRSQQVSGWTGYQNGPGLPAGRGGVLTAARRVMAGLTGLEPATSCVTGRRSNQLNYNPAAEAREIEPARASRAGAE